MAKRRATTELNRDNWDQEEEIEDPGTFKRVGDDELKNRIIRKAKRSLAVNRETSGSPASSPFAAFSGFAKSSGTNTANPFGFLKSNNNSVEESVTAFDGKDGKKENGSSSIAVKPPSSKMEVVQQSTDSRGATDKQKPKRTIEYYRQLQSLNESVMKWMQLHLAKNSCCDFTPVFNDYKKHLDTLNVTYPVRDRDSAIVERSDSTDAPAPSAASKEEAFQKRLNNTGANHELQLSNSRKSEDETDYGANFKSNTTNTSTFSFGIKKTPTATSSNTSRPTTSLGDEEQPQGPAEKKAPFQFSFGLMNKGPEDSAIKPFSFGVAASTDKTAAESESTAAAEDSEYVPPKNEFVAVKEEDAFYSKRCKLFYKKEDSYVERGVGTLHLKPLDGKTQLLIRADTSLGNILLNIVLSESLPMSKTGRNNILLVCVPNPPLDAKKADSSKEPIPLLIRVKTSEDADELLETLSKHKS